MFLWAGWRILVIEAGSFWRNGRTIGILWEAAYLFLWIRVVDGISVPNPFPCHKPCVLEMTLNKQHKSSSPNHAQSSRSTSPRSQMKLKAAPSKSIHYLGCRRWPKQSKQNKAKAKTANIPIFHQNCCFILLRAYLSNDVRAVEVICHHNINCIIHSYWPSSWR